MYLAKKAFNGLGQGFEGKLCKLFLSDYFDHFGMCAHEMMILQKPDLPMTILMNGILTLAIFSGTILMVGILIKMILRRTI